MCDDQENPSGDEPEQEGELPFPGRAAGDFLEAYDAFIASLTYSPFDQNDASHIREDMPAEFQPDVEDTLRSTRLTKANHENHKLEEENKSLRQMRQHAQDEFNERVRFRQTYGPVIINMVVVATIVTYLLILVGFVLDWDNAIDIAAGQISESKHTRFISEKVLLALIGATIVQISAIAITMGNWGFPNLLKSSKNDEDDK